MAKKRIFEVARELGVPTPEILELLAKHNINKSNLNAVDEKDMSIIQSRYQGGAAKKDAPKPAAAKTPVKEETAKHAGEPAKETPKAKPAAPRKEAPAAAQKKDAPAAAPKPPVRPKGTDHPSMIIKPVIMTVKADPDGNRSQTNGRRHQSDDQRNFPNDRNRYANFKKKENTAATTQPASPAAAGSTETAVNNTNSGNANTANRPQQNDGRNRYRNFNKDTRNQSSTAGGTRDNRQGGYNNSRNDNRQGSYNNSRTDNRQGGYSGRGDNRQGSSYNNSRNENRQGGYNNGRNDRRNDNRQGGYNNRSSQGGGYVKDRDNNAGSRSRFQQNRRPAAPAEDIPRGKESRERYNKKHEKQLKGSYASRDSRPMRSADHMHTNKHNKSMKKDNRPQQAAQIIRPTSVEIGESINVQEFAKMIKREVAEVIKSLFLLGEMVTINQDIDFDTATLVGQEFNVEVKPLPPEKDPTEIPEVEDDPKQQVTRPPVVTVMGHVDHGKTSLLDAIRKTHVTAREAGGITQHIGAYVVNSKGKKITFLDTPGHEAFTAMRARGAQCTDISVLVVAADDGVMPQTIEAINHSKAAGVPIIVAINKIDKPAANPDHVKQQLAELELIPEDWGGDTIMVPVSAHTHEGIDELLEMILLVAEVKELKANPKLPAHGVIIEAKLDKGRGPVATVLVQRGTLTIGDYIIAGTAHGRVRALINDRGEKVRKAGPSVPVEVLGLNEVPQAGDILDAADEKLARAVAEKRVAKAKAEQQKTAKVSLDDIFSRIKEGELKDLNIVVKADVQGSVEALCASLLKIQNDEVKTVIVHSGVGAINESDVMLASAANALIIGFNVRPDANARKLAEQEQVDIRLYRIIYDAINDVEAAVKGMLAPKFEEEIIGRVEIRQVITISKLLIAGCYVSEGKVTNNAKVRVYRDDIVIAEDEVESLRRFKDDVKEVQAGFECGLTLSKFHDIKVGDQLEVYVMKEVAPQ
ncbi:MAG: translation initiation factor IF-2 [Succiniclasticum sp.]|jgi:translation initiation factor IF-2